VSSDETAGDGGADSAIVSALGTVTPGPIRRSFALKFGLVLVVMALSVGVVGIAATQVITAQTEDNVEKEYRTLAAQEASIVEQWVERNRLSTRMLADSEALAADDPVSALRSESEKTSQDVEALHVIADGGDGLTVAGSHDKLGTADIPAEGREWFGGAAEEIRGLEEGEVYVSETYVGGDSQFVGFVSPVTAAADRYLLLEVSTFRLQDQLAGDDSDTAGFTQVVSADSEVVLFDGRGEDGATLETYATDDGTLEPVADGAALRDEVERSGVMASMPGDAEVIDEEYTVGYAPVEDTGWVLVTHEPRSSAFGLVDALSTWGLLVTAFAVVLIGVTGSLLGYSTSRSIDRLTDKTAEMREGHLDVSLSSPRVDEIGQLYDGFDEMRDALEQQIATSQQARKEAEVARAEAEELATALQETAEEYSVVMQEVGAGDLTERMDGSEDVESMERIATEFNAMIAELEKTIGQLTSYVDEVEEAGAEVERSSATVREASEQVAESIQQISDDARDQQERLAALCARMDDIADRVDELGDEHDVPVADLLEGIRGTCRELDDLAGLSEGTMAESENVAGAAEEQAAELTQVSERANDLQQYAQPVRDILERFETEQEHEFIFSIGPGSPSPGTQRREDD